MMARKWNRNRTVWTCYGVFTACVIAVGVGAEVTSTRVAYQSTTAPSPSPTDAAPTVTVADTPSEVPGTFDAPPLTPEDVASALARGVREDALQSMEASLPTNSAGFPVYRGTVCSDGWLSHSTGSGTCSHHGGEG